MTTTTPKTRTPAHLRKRTWFGTLGDACDVLVSVNNAPVIGRTRIPLPSGATITFRPDGSWLYRPSATPGNVLDVFTYTLQTPAGLVEGKATTDLTPFVSSTTAERILQRQDGWLSSTSGDGTSAVSPVQLTYEMLTSDSARLELRDTQESNRAVVLLESDSGLGAKVDADGLVCIHPQSGFSGIGGLVILVEVEAGRSEWLELTVAVNPPLRLMDSRR